MDCPNCQNTMDDSGDSHYCNNCGYLVCKKCNGVYKSLADLVSDETGGPEHSTTDYYCPNCKEDVVVYSIDWN